MKKLNKKGFTLIELLAVIVVLAILMLVAVQNIFPMIANARAHSFVSTVENVRDAANNKYMSDMLAQPTRGESCYTVHQLVTGGYVKVNDNNIIGAVCVVEASAGQSQYKILIVDKDNGYMYHTGLNAGDGSTAATNNYIDTSASIDTNVAAHFFDLGKLKDATPADVFTANGIKKATDTSTDWTGGGMPCLGTTAATNADDKVSACFDSAQTFTVHVFK